MNVIEHIYLNISQKTIIDWNEIKDEVFDFNVFFFTQPLILILPVMLSGFFYRMLIE